MVMTGKYTVRRLRYPRLRPIWAVKSPEGALLFTGNDFASAVWLAHDFAKRRAVHDANRGLPYPLPMGGGRFA